MSNFSSPSSIEQLKDCLLDITQPIAKRTHAAFHLRTIGTSECVLIIAEAIKQKEDTELMRHELGYILG
jgi:deoxyhypusine monooxygenase